MLDYKKEILSKKKTIKEELETLPTRIDEADRSKPDVQDWKELESKINENKDLINGIEDLISDKVKADEAKNKEILEWNQKILDAERYLQRLESALKVDYEKEDQEIDNKIIDLKKSGNRIAVKRNEGNSDINKVENSIKENNSTIQSIRKLQSDLRTEFAKENAKSFEMPEGECKCPTCQREFDEEVLLGKREELEANFNTNKAEKLASIKATGISFGSQIEELEKENAEAENQLTFLREAVALDAQDIELKKTEIAELEDSKSKEKPTFESFRDADPVYTDQVTLINQLKTGAPKKTDSDNSQIDQYKIQRSELQFKIDTIKIQLQDKAIIERTDKRIQELKDQEKAQVAKLNELEKDEFLIQQFTKAKITTIENTVNTHFQIVKWKMFRQLINGGEEECCEATVNGVNFQDVNTAGKINAGLDIINALSRYFNVNAPVVCDNRESCTEIIPVESQIINLIVSPADKRLRIENEVAEFATV